MTQDMIREQILDYLENTYKPRAVLFYGSYVRGDADEYSDFDCMVLVDAKTVKHDDAVIGGVRLDCFVFTVQEAGSEDPDIFLTAYDAEIVKDDGAGQALRERVRRYVEEHRTYDEEEKQFIESWIRKTLERMRKGDDEGHFRAVALLWESLTDYCLLRDRFYFGSKDTIRYLKDRAPEGYRLFHPAVTEKTPESIEAWGRYVIRPEK